MANSKNRFLPLTNVVNPSIPGSTGTKAVRGKAGDTRPLSMNARSTPVGITFGRPSSNNATSSEKGGSEWAQLLKQTASGGISSALGGGLGSVGGLGSIISGLIGLFGGGGKSTPPPLVEFHLPNSQMETVYTSSKGNATYQGSTTESPGSGASSSGIYRNSGIPSGSAANEPSLQYQSAQIAQAVKTALLNSSSLNDVIAEI